MMDSHDKFLKTSRNNWLRLGASFISTIQELETELERMKSKSLPADIIASKEHQIETLVSFYNETDELLTAYRIAIANKNAEIFITQDCLLHSFKKNPEPIVNRLRTHD